MFNVRLFGDEVLRQRAQLVTTFDPNLALFAEEMVETMKEKDGVGLAAPQVGNSIRLYVIDTTDGKEPAIVFINPIITFKSTEQEVREEGCLSLPDIRLNITRSSFVSVSAVNVQGVPFVIEKADGLLARAIQHELDHLNGIMIVDHISFLQRKMLAGKLKKLSQPALARSKDREKSPIL